MEEIKQYFFYTFFIICSFTYNGHNIIIKKNKKTTYSWGLYLFNWRNIYMGNKINIFFIFIFI